MPERDRHLAGAIETRRRELGLDVQQLVNLTGLTRQGLQPLLRGERKRYQDRLKLPLCEALEWTPDSIDRLLAGEEPVPLRPVNRPGESPEQLHAVRIQFATKIQEQADALDDLRAGVRVDVDALTAGAADQFAAIRSLQDDVLELRRRLEALEQGGRESG